MINWVVKDTNYGAFTPFLPLSCSWRPLVTLWQRPIGRLEGEEAVGTLKGAWTMDSSSLSLPP